MHNYLLLPCPFCGGRAYIEKHHRSFVKAESTHVSLVRCMECNAKTGKFDHREYGRSAACSAAVEAWNRRTVNA